MSDAFLPFDAAYRGSHCIPGQGKGGLLDEVTMKQLRTGIDGKINKRAEPVESRLVSLSPDGVMLFKSSSITVWPGRRDAYDQHVELLDWGEALKTKGSFVNKANLAIFGDVRVSCNCPNFMFHGYRYILTQLGALFTPSPMHAAWADQDAGGGPEDRFPEIRNPELEGVVCKHLSNVLYVATMSVSKVASLMKEMVRRGDIELPDEIPEESKSDVLPKGVEEPVEGGARQEG